MPEDWELEYGETIRVMKGADFTAEKWEQHVAPFRAAEAAHGPEYCAQPMCCMICMFKHLPNGEPVAGA